MEGDFIRVNKKLRPLSWFYGLGVGFRNLLFEMGALKSRSYDTPVISVGNITVGGTGKTPHVEYLVRLLKDQAQVAVLSRGYKRKSHGFLIAEKDTPMTRVGDEPYQMKQKFPEVTIAVDRKRTHGIGMLLEGEAGHDIDVILLDDAFQHRYVKPGINILLVDYHRLIIYDELLPSGRLREPLKGKDRADIVIVTKCPKDLKPMEYRVLTKQMRLFPYQRLYFTTLDYEPLKSVFPNTQTTPSTPNNLEDLSNQNVLLLTGIASPKQLQHDLGPHVASLHPLTFGDHHAFRQKDIRRLNELFETLPQPRMVITTEKDAVRLKDVKGISDEVRSHLYVLPVRICFMQDGEKLFNDQITGYLRKHGHSKTR